MNKRVKNTILLQANKHYKAFVMDSSEMKAWKFFIPLQRMDKFASTPSVHKNMQFSFFEKSNSLNFD
jgi:hypothetical protein